MEVCPYSRVTPVPPGGIILLKVITFITQVSGENSADGATSMINLGSTLMTLHDAAARAEAGHLPLALSLTLFSSASVYLGQKRFDR